MFSIHNTLIKAMNIEDLNIKSVSYTQYNKEQHPKKQIYLHHTAGTGTGSGCFAGWEKKANKIATCVVIDRSGQITQGFPSSAWAYHLGTKVEVFKKAGVPYTALDKISIGIELINWGGLTEKEGKFYSYTGREVTDVCKVKYKLYEYWESYTPEQIESTRKLLLYWGKKYGIDLTYNPDIFEVNKRALKGEAGVFTHNSTRVDKVDVYPHPGLVEMLKSL